MPAAGSGKAGSSRLFHSKMDSMKASYQGSNRQAVITRILNEILRGIILLCLLAACIAASYASPSAAEENAGLKAEQANDVSLRDTPVATRHTPGVTQPTVPRATHAATATHTTVPTYLSTPMPSGPDSYPAGVNPLTGLAVKDPMNMRLPPALVSISNSPVTTRPQAGLSFCPVVYEMYIGEGATRFLGVFYGDYPITDGIEGTEEKTEIGPIRSGRLPYERLRQLYSGYLLFAGAAPRVLDFISGFSTVLNEDAEDVNGATVSSAEIKTMAQARQSQLGEPQLFGLRFDPIPPEGGKPADKVWVDFHYHAQVFWQYDPVDGSYHRYQDSGEGTPLVEATDRLTGEPLTVENLVILYANYERYDDLFFNIDLMYIYRFPAFILRDGKIYEAFWTTRNERYEYSTGRIRPFRFIYYDGTPFPIKPGQTWVEIVQLHSPYYETADSTTYYTINHTIEKDSGNWAMRNALPTFMPIQDSIYY